MPVKLLYNCKYPKNPDNLKVEKIILTLNCQYEEKVDLQFTIKAIKPTF